MSEIINEELIEDTVSENEESTAKEVADENEEGMTEAPAEERVVIFEEALEAILFAAGHPISYATLARVFEMTPGKVKDKVFEYSLKYNDPAIPRGVILLTYGDSCQLCTKKYYLNEIREALGIKRSGTLSTSSMEALAIVAYNQPVTRIFVDTLRRADSSYAMNNLIDRGLIEAQGRLDAPGRPMLYGTTPDFLRVFGLKDISELPTASEEITDMFAKGVNALESDEAVQEEMSFPELDGESSVGDDNVKTESDSAEGSDGGTYSEADLSYDEASAEDDFYDDEDLHRKDESLDEAVTESGVSEESDAYLNESIEDEDADTDFDGAMAEDDIFPDE